MAAAEKFKAQENPAGIGGDLPSTISQPIQEESEEEGEVSYVWILYMESYSDQYRNSEIK